MTGINYGASSVSATAQADALAAYNSLVLLAASSSTPIAPVMDSTRRFPGVYTCIPYCNLGGGVLTLDAQGVSFHEECLVKGSALRMCHLTYSQDPTSVFVFVTSGYLAASPASQMALVNGARASNGE